MAKTQIRGGSTTTQSQIQDATVFDLQIAAAAGIATSKLAQGSLFMLSTGATMSGPLNMGSGTPTVPAGMQPIQQVLDPVNNQDAATKNYVDTRLAAGGGAAATARGASVANLTLSGVQTIDGVTYVAGQAILVKDQTTPSANGLYVVASGVWTRHTAMNTWAQVPGMIISVEEGTQNHDTVWLSTADVGGTLGTTPITFVQMPGPSDILAGAGLQRSGQTMNVVAADTSISLTGSAPNNNGTIAVKLDPARAVTVVATGIGVNIDTSTMQFISNQVGVKSNLFLAASNTIIREAPSGTINGSNVTFTLAGAPSPANTEQIFLNGLLQNVGAGNDYTISGATITFTSAPPTGSVILVNYWNRSLSPT